MKLLTERECIAEFFIYVVDAIVQGPEEQETACCGGENYKMSFK